MKFHWLQALYAFRTDVARAVSIAFSFALARAICVLKELRFLQLSLSPTFLQTLFYGCVQLRFFRVLPWPSVNAGVYYNFYYGSVIGRGFAPILFHFFLVFPQPSPLVSRFPRFEFYLYLPFLLTVPLGAIELIARARNPDHGFEGWGSVRPACRRLGFDHHHQPPSSA